MNQTANDTKNTRIVAGNAGEATQMLKMKKFSFIATVILSTFLLGFVPMWLSARGYENELNEAQSRLRPSDLQNNLATAALLARRDEYEPARQQTSDFFTALRQEFDRAEKGAFADAARRESISQILEQRDETITLLARNDAASADRLTDLYFIFYRPKMLRRTVRNWKIRRLLNYQERKFKSFKT